MTSGGRRTLAVVVAVMLALAGWTAQALAGPSSPDAGSPRLQSLSAPAEVAAVARRGEQFVAGPVVPACRRVVVIGDSLTDNARWFIEQAFARVGQTALVDAKPGRRLPAGAVAAQHLRASWGDADCWVIALGSNDLGFGAADPAVAAPLIDTMVTAVSPGARVWWVNLDYHRDPRVAFNFPAATRVFNGLLDARAVHDPDFAVIDWFSLARANPGWFFDAVHVDRAGSLARAEQIVASLPPPVDG